MVIVQATMHGQGIAWLHQEFFNADIESGRLVGLFHLTPAGESSGVLFRTRQHSPEVSSSGIEGSQVVNCPKPVASSP